MFSSSGSPTQLIPTSNPELMEPMDNSLPDSDQEEFIV
jgi:hypothetical protein